MYNSNNNFEPIQLAITLPKGYALEYRDRNWFDQIYFSKLSMIHEQEGFMPILYQFDFFHEVEGVLPEQMLMTFYYPERRISNLNGIIIIGGRPDIYDAYKTTIQLTPQLESLLIDEFNISKEPHKAHIDRLLHLLSYPKRLKPIDNILERSLGRKDENLASFFPILADEDYEQKILALPMDFDIDAVFVFELDEEFFTAEQPGQGIKTIELYHRSNPSTVVQPKLAYPLIIKWQPIYNDILTQLQSRKSNILPVDYKGHLTPRIVIFKQQETGKYTALISKITQIQDTYYYHAAVANSGQKSGQPLSLLDKALGREKFGTEAWMRRIGGREYIPKDSIKDRNFSEDLISTDLKIKVQKTSLQLDGQFDLGKLRSISMEE